MLVAITKKSEFVLPKLLHWQQFGAIFTDCSTLVVDLPTVPREPGWRRASASEVAEWIKCQKHASRRYKRIREEQPPPGAPVAADPAPWRALPPTEAQLRLLDKWARMRHDDQWRDPETRGQASDIIDNVVAEAKARDRADQHDPPPDWEELGGPPRDFGDL